ncbi:DNA sulfur modification protein DndD [Acaryochloris sp. CCMEE 5410]|uniref:DNA sulfur modification protein DndD n=1 Tax=Acaryochloris sp. CCMEE 5410 TaxID=310037 RepID=UPI0002483CD3|nr:DNA sulfur modification protein DndD [Acaryochloris sp. CCMEE 5410]KAI9130029.1 DNA sulfur modification protein DndD [Acaryochloris sp. CCMEE 5410]
MIFQELVLQNFGPYRGRQVIHLAPLDSAQPIILFGGMNGGGKTTLMDAIRLALYGHRAPCSTRGNLAYKDFLVQTINQQTNGEPTAVELSLQLTLNNAVQPTTFQICRSWTKDTKSSRDKLDILVDGELDPALTKTWDQRIEDLLPLGIANLFLFDGEQVKELAEQDELPSVVVGAMRSLLGLELPDRLSADLGILASRKSKAISSNQESQTLETIEQKLAELEAQRLSAKKHNTSVYSELDEEKKNLNEAQERFLAKGGKIAAERSQLERQLQQAKDEAQAQRRALREFAAGVLPLALIQPLLQDVQEQLQTEVRYEQFQGAKDLLQERNQHLLSFVETLQIDQTKVQKIRNFLDQEDEDWTHPQTQPWLNATADHLHQLTQILNHSLPAQQQLVQERLNALQAIEETAETAERYMATAASPETYEKLSQQVTEAQNKVAKLTVKHEQTQREYDKITQKIAQIKKELLSYSQTTLEQLDDEHILKSISTVQEKLQIFKQRLKLQKLNQLETLVTQCFLHLLHKSNLVHRVEIDTEAFTLSLFDQTGQSVPKHRLSAGEKQLLAIALLWGLAQASGRQLPIAIDTPLGRLDSSHRKNIVKRYFPQASHQVLLLSTDTEIGKPEIKELRKNKAISREYLLHYDAKMKQTQVQTGYFWK